MGNHKLVYRAVQRWSPPASLFDDMAGDCLVVLINVVSAYNPFLGVRFSTYAFTCLMRALSRISQRRASDRLARWQPLDSVLDSEMASKEEEQTHPILASIYLYLREDNDLLSSREKSVLLNRFNLDGQQTNRTLEQVCESACRCCSSVAGRSASAWSLRQRSGFAARSWSARRGVSGWSPATRRPIWPGRALPKTEHLL